MFPMIGQIILVPYDFAPSGWMFCDGAQLPISENESLFQLIGTEYGGDGVDTFALPDLRAAAPKNCSYCISLVGVVVENFLQAVIGETVLLPKQIRFPGNFVQCTGQTLTKNQYFVLGQYIGKKFGGDGVNTIGLPDLVGKSPAKEHPYLLAVAGDIPEVLRERKPYVGQLILLPMDQEYENLRLCNGGLLPVSDNTALYALIRNKFGGDDKQMKLPDLRASVPVPGYNYYLSRNGIFPQRP